MHVSVEKRGFEFDIVLSNVSESELREKLNSITNTAFGIAPAVPADPFERTGRDKLEVFVRNMAPSLHKINMIKAIRCLTTAGLKEAKDFVDELESRCGLKFGEWVQTSWS